MTQFLVRLDVTTMLASIDWLNAVLIPVCITFFIGGAVSIWAAFVVVRLVDFQNTIRATEEEILAAVSDVLDRRAFAVAQVRARARLWSHYSRLYDAGQFAAATAVANELGNFEAALVSFASAVEDFGRRMIDQVAFEQARSTYKEKLTSSSQSISRLRPELFGVLYGSCASHLCSGSKQMEKEPPVV